MRQGLLSYGNGDEKKGTHSLAEGRPEHYYNSLSFPTILYHFLLFYITISNHFFTIPLMVILSYAPTSLTQGGFSFTLTRKNPRREIIFSLKRSAKREAEG